MWATVGKKKAGRRPGSFDSRCKGLIPAIAS
jgi:hypothetical protein